MKFPETKTHSPFYKMPSPSVEKAPMVPFISSFLRRRPGPGLFVQMGGRERAQGRRGRGGGEGGRRWLGRGVGAGEVSGGRDEWTGIVPREAPAAGRQGFGKDGFPSSGSATQAPPSLQRTSPYLSAAAPPPEAQAVARPLPKVPEVLLASAAAGPSAPPARSTSWAPAMSNPHTSPSTAAPHPPSPITGTKRPPARPLWSRASPPPGLCASVSHRLAPHSRLLLFGAALAQTAPRPLQPIARVLPSQPVYLRRVCTLAALASPVSAGMEASREQGWDPCPPRPPPSGAWGTHTEPSPLCPPATPLSAAQLPNPNISLLNLHTSFLPGLSQLKTC